MSTLTPIQQLILQHFVLLPEDKKSFYGFQQSEARQRKRISNPEVARIQSRESSRVRRAGNPEIAKKESREAARKRRFLYPEKVRREHRERRAKNREALRFSERIRYSCNREKILFYAKKRYATDLAYRLKIILRTRLTGALRGVGSKSARTLQLLGCTIPELRKYLETQFRPGMTWENYGPVWHVDHKRPCASFNLIDPAQQQECFNFKNLQPLFAEENLKKGDRQ